VKNLKDVRKSLGAAFSVHACDHIGGHAFAGNAVVYPEVFFHPTSISKN
jgi:hypothetical protein